jgi:predicted DNA-binding transcriptional regulator AlpA
MQKELMAPRELGAKLGKSQAALAQWRYLGVGPKFIKIGRNIRYRSSDVEAWLDVLSRLVDDTGIDLTQ